MEIEHYSEKEALEKVGQRVLLLEGTSEVPAGTCGVVVDVESINGRDWMLEIEWGMARESLSPNHLGYREWYTRPEYESHIEEQGRECLE